MKRLLPALLLCLCLSLGGCMKWDYGEETYDINLPSEGLFILCEGNFHYGNSTVSYYFPAENFVDNELFFKANGMKLGDVAQSITIYDNRGWIVVNNSHVVFAIDLTTMKEKGRITNLTSPRYIHFVSADKAYITQLWDNRIYIVDPDSYSVTGYITVPGMAQESGSTEQMVQVGKYVYCTCWSYNNQVIKIDTETDRVVDSVVVGIQPRSIVSDSGGNIWVMTDGGYENSPYGFEQPALVCLNPESLEVVRYYPFEFGRSPLGLTTNSEGTKLFWIDDDVWEMDIEAGVLPEKPLIEARGTRYFGLTVSPFTGDIYVADAIDYMQKGIIYRYSHRGEYISEFYVGVNPSAFCWNYNSNR